MAFPTFQSVGAASLAFAAASPDDYLQLSLAWGASHQAGDIGFWCVYDDGAATGSEISPGAGWTLISQQAHASARLTVYWRRATSSSEANAGFITSTGLPTGSNAYGVIISYRGCVTGGNPVDVSASATRTSGTSCTFPTVTTTAASDMIVMIGSRDNSSAAAAWSAQTNAALASITERFDAGTTAGNGGGLSITDGTKSAAGSTGTTSSTVTTSAGSMITIALKTDAGPGGSSTLTLNASGSLVNLGSIFGSATLSFSAVLNPPSGAMAGSASFRLTARAVPRFKGGDAFRFFFGQVYKTKQALQNAIYAKTKALAEASDNVLNPSFENGSLGWTFGSGWTVEENPIAVTGSKVAKKSSGNADSSIANVGRFSATQGKRVVAVASFRSGAGTGLAGTEITWYSQNGTLLPGTNSVIATTPAQCAGIWVQARTVGVAPTGAAWGCVTARITGYTSGIWYCDQVSLDVQPQNQTDLSPVGVGSVGSRWNGLSITSTVPSTGTTITIDVSAASLVAGDKSIPYNASSVTVSQVRSTTVVYHLYYLDPTFLGGAQTLNVTTDPNNLANGNSVVWVGSISVVVPGSGTSGGGPGAPGGGIGDGNLLQ